MTSPTTPHNLQELEGLQEGLYRRGGSPVVAVSAVQLPLQQVQLVLELCGGDGIVGGDDCDIGGSCGGGRYCGVENAE